MATAANPFYYQGNSDLGATMGALLGKALFGDPEMAAKQQLQRAQMANYEANAAEANAHAGLYGEQTTGEHTKNTALSGLPATFAAMFGHAPAAAAPVDPLAPLPDPNAPPPAPAPDNVTFDPQTFRNGLPAAVAALVQAGVTDPAKALGTLSAFTGDDEFARRGMVADGVTPGKDFALTPGRADDIAQQGYAADYKKDTAVAGINHASDIPIANIQAQTARRGQDVSAQTQRRGQDLEHQDRVYGINVKAGADIANPAGANVLARALGPNAVITSNARTPDEQRAVYAQQHPGKAPVMDSAHLDAADGYPGFDVRPVPGETFEQAKQKVAAQAAAQGGYLHQAIDEGTHWHFDIRGVKSSTKSLGDTMSSLQKPKAITASSSKMIDDEINTQLAARGIAGQPDPGTMQRIRDAAFAVYQRTGNPAQAVSSTLDVLQQRWSAKQNAKNHPDQVATNAAKLGAKKAPDGNWYVQRGGKYYRVDVTG